MHGGNDGKLRGVRWQGEAEVTADGGGLRLLPATVRRNVPADGVALLSVRRVARGKRRDVWAVDRRDGRVEAEITQVGHIPVGVAAVFFRRFGEVVRREGVAVAELLPLEHLAACDKAERQVQQLLGNAIRRLQCADVGAQLRGVQRGSPGGAAEVVQNGCGLGGIALHDEQEVIHRRDVRVHEVGQLAGERPSAALGGIGTGRDAGDAAGDAVGGRLCVVERAVYETLQRVQLSLQLVESAGGKAQRDVGHHLADDAADVRLRPGGDDLALDGEVPDGRTALHAAEKAVLRAALRQAQAGDLVSLSVEVSEEDRDRDGGAVRDASGDDAQVDVAVDAGADKAADRAADLTGHKVDDKHTLARLVRPRGGGHGDAGLIRQSAAEQQNLRQNEQHEQH